MRIYAAPESGGDEGARLKSERQGVSSLGRKDVNIT